MLVPPESSSAVLVMISRICLSICNRSDARRANSGKITISSFMPSFEGNLITQRHQIISLETRDSRLSYGENPESLSDLGLIRYRVVTPQTDRQTDRIPIANTHSQQYLPVQLSRVKTSQMLDLCSTPPHWLDFITLCKT